MGRDLDDVCADIKRRASLAMEASREKMSDEELDRTVQKLAEDIRIGLLIVSGDELALRTGIAKEVLVGIAADAPKDQRIK